MYVCMYVCKCVYAYMYVCVFYIYKLMNVDRSKSMQKWNHDSKIGTSFYIYLWKHKKLNIQKYKLIKAHGDLIN